MFRQIRFLPSENVHGRLLPWVVAVMVFLAGVAMLVALGLQATAQTWHEGLSRSLTVQVINADPDGRAREVAAVLDELRRTPGIADAREETGDEVAALLEPWLGKGNVGPDLPIPALIDVKLAPEATVDVEALGQALVKVAPSVRVDAHERWLADLLVLMRIVQWVSGIIVGLVGLATVVIIVFATRANLAAQRDTVEIVHMMGARDGLIAGAYQRRFLVVGIKGAILGLIFLGLGMLAIHFVNQRLEGALLPQLIPDRRVLASLLVLPFAAGLITMLTARFAVKRALADMN
ncbi:FtsX-like permease family protein [Iodidimonas sp. SYSU 1G8]|uniref:cell division protein FtsX n=1 Tax=Iodidimonas sp. SYSU 1G8 TaxID=3133967 RepID=UPI0031FE91C0